MAATLPLGPVTVTVTGVRSGGGGSLSHAAAASRLVTATVATSINTVPR